MDLWLEDVQHWLGLGQHIGGHEGIQNVGMGLRLDANLPRKRRAACGGSPVA